MGRTGRGHKKLLRRKSRKGGTSVDKNTEKKTAVNNRPTQAQMKKRLQARKENEHDQERKKTGRSENAFSPWGTETSYIFLSTGTST